MKRLLLILACTLTIHTSTAHADCAGDVDSNERVDVNDLLVVISTWGECPNGVECPADTDANGLVDVSDLLTVISQWGPCTGCTGDLDGNDEVDVNDLLTVIGNWGACP